LTLTTALLSCCGGVSVAHAAYPDKPIKLVVPFPPGGNVDVTTRAIATAMGRELKQSIVIENMGGAAGAIGNANVARSKPDGYTLASTTITTLVVNPLLMPGTKTHISDFEAAGIMASVPCVLEVPAGNKLGVKTFQEFIDYARAHPGAVTLAHGGNGTMNHITTILLRRDFGIQVNIIPYNGSAPALSDMLGGHVDAMVDQLTSSQSQLKGGTVTALATTATQRVADLPNVPTFTELGKPDFQLVTYSVLMAPKGTPKTVLDTLNGALLGALADPAVQNALRNTGASALPVNVAQTAELIHAEQGKLEPLVRSAVPNDK
jgi:tripartite-type tricarboxylate transporter receptor subunit TctC